MSRCKQCNVEILDETERCPLCHSVLEKTVEVENMYPNVRTMTRRLALLSRIYLFVAILVEALLPFIIAKPFMLLCLPDTFFSIFSLSDYNTFIKDFPFRGNTC